MKNEIDIKKLENLSEFEIQYFIQTRKEIDTEKQERNKLLNYGVVATGALTLGIMQIDKSFEILSTPLSLLIYFSLQLFIFGIVVARRVKLRHIADRWETLYDFLQHRNLDRELLWLEKKVIAGFNNRRRYLWEDFVLYCSLNIIVFGFLLYSTFFSSFKSYTVMILTIWVIMFFGGGWVLLKPFKINIRN